VAGSSTGSFSWLLLWVNSPLMNSGTWAGMGYLVVCYGLKGLRRYHPQAPAAIDEIVNDMDDIAAMGIVPNRP
jgi:hypothetical protein